MFAATRTALGGKFWKPLPDCKTRKANDLKRIKQIAAVEAFLKPYHVPASEKTKLQQISRSLPYYAQNQQFRQTPKLRPASLPPVNMDLARKILEERKKAQLTYLKEEYGFTPTQNPITKQQVIIQKIKKISIEGKVLDPPRPTAIQPGLAP